MNVAGLGLGPFDQLAPETSQHEVAHAPDFPFVMITVPAWWAIVAPSGLLISLVEGGAVNPMPEGALVEASPNRRVAAARRARGWLVRPASADEIEQAGKVRS